MPRNGIQKASSVVIDGMVYFGGSRYVTQYNPESGDWSSLPEPPPHVENFAVTSFHGQLVLVGGWFVSHAEIRGNRKITVWNSDRSEWVHPYPHMSTRVNKPAAVGYKNYLIVADYEVQVFDSSSNKWYHGQSLPVRGCWFLPSVVVGDRWYLSSSRRCDDDKKRHIYWAHLPTLISSALGAHTELIWHELPTPPVKYAALLSLQGHLLLVGGKEYVRNIHSYDQHTRQWRISGQLPVGIEDPCCTVLPSGDLMVAGGITGDTKTSSNRMWTGTLDIYIFSYQFYFSIL